MTLTKLPPGAPSRKPSACWPTAATPRPLPKRNSSSPRPPRNCRRWSACARTCSTERLRPVPIETPASRRRFRLRHRAAAMPGRMPPPRTTTTAVLHSRHTNFPVCLPDPGETGMSQSLHVIILAAGEGKRMKSALPKVLLPLAGRPLLAHVLETARLLRPDAIHVVYGHGGDRVREAFADARDVVWTNQPEQRGTGDAVRLALAKIGRASCRERV